MTWPDLPEPGVNYSDPSGRDPANKWSAAIPVTQREHWVRLLHQPLDQSHLDTVFASDPWTGKTQSVDTEYLQVPPDVYPAPGNIRDVYIGYSGNGHRYFSGDWNSVLGPTYGGWPKQSRFYEFLTDPAEPFPSYYGTSEPYEWWSLSFDPGSTGGYGGTRFYSGSQIPWNSVGHWRRYGDGDESISPSSFSNHDPEWYSRLKWINAGMTWCDTTGWSGMFSFGMRRKTHAGYTVGTRVHRLGEETDPVAYEAVDFLGYDRTIDPAELNPDFLDYLPRGWLDPSPDQAWLSWLATGMDGFRDTPPDPEWQTPLYSHGTTRARDVFVYRDQNTRRVRYPSDQPVEILEWRMVLRLRDQGTFKHLTPGKDAGQIDRYELYTSSSPTYVYPWDPGWVGTKFADLDLTWGTSAAGNFHGHEGHGSTFTAYSDPSVAISGLTVTPFTDPLLPYSVDGTTWKSFYVTGISPYDLGAGGYSDIHIVPHGYFNEPPISAALVDGESNASSGGNFYAAAYIQASIEWEARVRLPTEFKLIWEGQYVDDSSVLRYLGREDGYGNHEAHARLGLYSGSEKHATRLRGEGSGSYL